MFLKCENKCFNINNITWFEKDTQNLKLNINISTGETIEVQFSNQALLDKAYDLLLGIK